MRLKKIKLAGFKSFVDPTTFTLPSSLIGVVGPNGCGKSNVIDAVRWVMGESSAKHLRGESLTDVIFNGSTARKPVGHASIELIFDNTDGRLGGQYAEYTEIAVKRHLSRDGQSIYYLNGTRCRRRDITDIFLGTGLGPRSYAIIEQGTISRLIEAKPDELRVFLEEAAGISKYKERRRETENRIRSTRDNINRINDIVEELEKRLQTLQRQANTAERYKVLKKEERLLKAQLTALRWHALDCEVKEKEKDIKARENAIEAQRAETLSIEAEIEKQRAQHNDDNENFNAVQGQFYSAGAEIARVEQSIQHATEKHQQNSQDLQEVEQAFQQAQQHLESDSRKINDLGQVLDDCEPTLREQEDRESQSSAALGEAELAMQSWQADWDSFNSKAASQLQQAEVERTRIEHFEDLIAKLKNRLNRVEEDQVSLSTSRLDDETLEIEGQVSALASTIENLQQDLHSTLAQITHNREQNNQLAEQLNREKSRLQELHKQQASLEAMQKVALGKGQEHISIWLEEHNLQDVKRLAEELEVDPGWEHAVESVLGMHLEALCVEGFESVAEQVATLQQGALSFFDTSSAFEKSGSTEVNASPLGDKVRSRWNIDSLLADVFAVETLSDAISARATLKNNESVITREGVWVGSNWLRVSHKSDEKGSVLEREQELKVLHDEIEPLTAEITSFELKLEEAKVTLQTLENEREILQKKLNEVATEHGEKRARLSSLNARLEQIDIRRKQLQEDYAEINAQSEKSTFELKDARIRLESALSQTAQHEQLRNDLLEQRDELRRTLEQSRHQARQDRDTARETAHRIETTRLQLESLQNQVDRMQNQQSHLSRRRDELTQAISNGDAPIVAMKEELEQLLSTRLDIETALLAARKQLEDTEHLLKELDTRRYSSEQQYQQMRDLIESLRMEWQEIQVRRQTQQEQIDNTDFELKTLLDEMPEGADEAGWQESVDKMSQKIQRLGAINLAAIEEFDEESERKAYLDSQLTDLNDALNTLENAIRKIDHETRTRFKDTFDHANDRLQELFPRLFGGGVARLELTGEELLDAGVNIIARPPGKKNSSIHLLSGGEKALTAVALVFALFELNPSPFCMLDEVDAPLDDTNAARFCQMVKEMSDSVQFIFITHNKITMELANQLIGVTMHEPGVSRLVAVDVEEAAEMVAV
ncbi:MAG: chromosome segregation protein SMC [Gammaproteobacteria bacterium]